MCRNLELCDIEAERLKIEEPNERLNLLSLRVAAAHQNNCNLSPESLRQAVPMWFGMRIGA